MSGPTVADLRRVAQPAGHLERRNGEHWAGVLYMRRLSIYVTWLMSKTSVTPNQLTWVMTVAGVLAGVVLALPGLWAAVGAALLVQVYLLLDCSDGELARWTGKTSLTGVYLDRVGAYFTEAALLAGLGWRASAVLPDWYTVLGFAAALGAILIKAETDLVDVARAKGGLPAATEASVGQFRSGLLGLARRVVGATKFHRIMQPIELSMIALVTAVIDLATGDLLATRVLVVACVVAAGLQTVLHLVSILASRRLV
ncbi:CDP-alcohol phosphatidyltransferase family protein [Nonomuraea glycinis]|jgi:phosphatidylglycerophosphate synthase|uniref:Transferase n=1 Tax=Nonomuraea glycinis TaxID=2047744 RepID=A0A918A3E1_9ACTN|nr:CDP-alcohol phosphatidyltransferase family protein [Nonomuraea glycinis]MCA2176008.1 CDP-alcohol phosphatidyltransferase family protein [Nonomuraea glycinis]WSG71723.1 CDP-alcohol phosphatidyltransferase family protein [Nonomuraea glycinis]GGP05834.1 transferase [Nonomuraea glycinis]